MYDQAFFETIADGCRASAAVVAPLVLETYQPATVVDVGGGEGWWAQAFEALGCDTTVIDGEYAAPDIVADLAKPLTAKYGWYDLAVCLEVAEHLPASRAASFVADLCNLAPVVLFSAAIPGQGGTGHLNEQWPAYWVDLFAANGYACSGALRWQIWNDDRVENWYRQNLIVACASPDLPSAWFDTPLAAVWPVVHPVLYDARRS